MLMRDAAARVTKKIRPAATTLETPVQEATVTITARGASDKTSAEFDAWQAGVDALVWPNSHLAGTVTLATSLFPNGIEFDQSNQGSRWDESTDTRVRTRSFRVIFRP